MPAVLLVAVGMTGCKKGAAETSLTADTLPGVWKVTTVEGIDGGMAGDLKSGELTLWKDGKFQMKNNAVGRYGGTWAIAGETLTLTTGANESSLMMKSKTLKLTGVKRVDSTPPINVVYERQGDAPAEPADPGTPAAAADPVKFTADQYFEAVNTDRATTLAKNAGKLIELTGTVKSVDASNAQWAAVKLYGGPGQTGASDTHTVTCQVADKSAAGKLVAGQLATIRGEAEGSHLKNAAVVQPAK